MSNSTDQISSQELYNWLFEACNIMRGPINQDEYKSYITPLLFYKRISDNWDEEYDKALKESDGDKEYAAFPEIHIIQIPNGCHWLDVRNKTENVGEALVNAMNGIERANQKTLGGLFSSFDDANWTDKNRFTDERLKDLIEHMSEKRLRNSDYSADIMGDAYEYLLKKFADMQKKNAGEFFTPRSIVKLMVWLLDPRPGDSIYDKIIAELIQIHENNNTLKPYKIRASRCFCFMGKWHRKRAGKIQARICGIATPRGCKCGGCRLHGI